MSLSNVSGANQGGTFRITGGKELADAMRGLPDKVNERIIRAASKKAAEVIRAAAASAAPVDEGYLQENILIQAKTSRQLALIKVNVGLRKGKDSHGVDVFYGRFVEDGTEFQDANPYLEPAFDAHKAEYVDIFIAELRPRVTRALDKISAKRK